MEKCVRSKELFCFKVTCCEECSFEEIEKLNQMVPQPRTIGQLITILSQYPEDTKLLGLTTSGRITDLITVQGNCPEDDNGDPQLDNVMICYYNHDI